ncbi:MAG: segregation/condensation protein A [Ruminococcus sp.]|nr:segregation/condensation protein A [Ruminococcus sp.]
MTAARFKLDMFEGPLDLLLHLIAKHKLNIYDIEISSLLEQYLDYLGDLDHEDYEDAADFLEMAARLIYIKTCSLLPHEEEAQAMKKELEGRMIEYSLCKIAAQRLGENYIGGDIFVREPVKLPVNRIFTGERDAAELLAAYLGMSEKARVSKPLRADIFQPIVSRKIVSVTSKIIFVLKKLFVHGEFDMDELYDGITDKSERVATFLAVLELTKSGRIFLNDDNTKVYMNKAAKKRRIRSDFDSDTELRTAISAETPPALSNEYEDAVPLEQLESVYSERTEQKQRSTRKSPSYMNERVRPVMCQAAAEDIDSIADDCTDTGETDGYLQISESCPSDEEIEKLAGLPADPPVTVFKPNYFSCVKYFWGRSPVGYNAPGNYWRYGIIR